MSSRAAPESTLRTPSLYLITDGYERRSRGELVEWIAEALIGGRGRISAVQIREQRRPEVPPATDEEVVALASAVRPLCHEAGAKVILNRRLDLVDPAGADGVHVGGESSPRDLPPGILWGYAAHTLEELREPSRRGAAYALFSPIFTPLSKETNRSVHGIAGLAEACLDAPCPVFALGGIAPHHVGLCLHAGARGVAGIGSIFSSDEPRAIAARFAAELDRVT